MSIVEVEHARVHLTFPKDSVFLEQRQPAKASVLLKLRAGAKLSQRSVTAIGHLVASAVEGLKPDAVTVVDMNGNLLNKPPVSEEEERRYTPLDYKDKVERDLLAKMNTTLAAVLGPDHFRAGVTAEVDFTKGEQSEETWDPTKSVMVSQQRTEEMNGGAIPSGVPGTPSNLPRPPTRPGSRDGGILRRTENVTYQSSRLVRRTTLPEGVIKRLTVSAVIDQNVRWEGSGAKAKRVLEPPSDETLKKVRDLIAAAVGFSEQRGDQIVVQSLPFESTLRNASPPADPVATKTAPQSNPIGLEKWLAEKNIKVNITILLAAAGVLALLMIGAVVFFLTRRKKNKPATGTSELAKQRELEEPGDVPARSKLPAVTQPAQPPAKGDKTLAQFEAREAALRHEAEREVLNALKIPELTTKKAEVLIGHITEQAKRDSVGAANLIRSWLMEKEK
jgi:flagellar M-ring protein FliF